MSKTATLTLVHRQTPNWSHTDTKGQPEIVDHFTVEKITDSVDYMPGQDLTKAQVADLCRNGGWKVIIQKLK